MSGSTSDHMSGAPGRTKPSRRPAGGRRGRSARAGITLSVAGLATATLLAPAVAHAAGEQSGSVSRSGVARSATTTTGLGGTEQRSVAARKKCSLSAKLVPSCGLAFGAYALPQGGEGQMAAFGRFSRTVKHDLDIIHNYHQGAQKFPTAGEKALTRRPGINRTLLMNWKPENGLTWRQVAAGKGDALINAEARYIKKSYKPKFFLAIHHEPENDVRGAGSGFSAMNYRAMYRHVVDRFRANGVKNVVYVMNYMGAQKWAEKSWYKNLYPGYRYVDWLAFDPYLTKTNGTQVGTFSRLMNLHWGNGSWRGAYHWAAKHHPRKPIMLAEWGIGEKPGSATWKSSFYKSAIKEARKFPKLKALVYFSNPKGASGDARPNTSTRSLTGFRAMLRSNIFM